MPTPVVTVPKAERRRGGGTGLVAQRFVVVVQVQQAGGVDVTPSAASGICSLCNSRTTCGLAQPLSCVVVLGTTRLGRWSACPAKAFTPGRLVQQQRAFIEVGSRSGVVVADGAAEFERTGAELGKVVGADPLAVDNARRDGSGEAMVGFVILAPGPELTTKSRHGGRTGSRDGYYRPAHPTGQRAAADCWRAWNCCCWRRFAVSPACRRPLGRSACRCPA